MSESTALATIANVNNVAARIDGMSDADSARSCIDDMALLEQLLKRAHKYKEYATKYLVLECDMWLKITELHETRSAKVMRLLSRKECNLVEWLLEKDDAERLKVREYCRAGRSVYMQRADEVSCSNARTRPQMYGDIIEAMAKDCARNGRVTANYEAFIDRWRDRRYPPNPEIIRAYVKVARDTLLKNGAVSLGDGTGEYFLPSPDEPQKAYEAAMQRLQAIENDIRSVCKLLSTAEITMMPHCTDGIRDALACLEENCSNEEIRQGDAV